ncbi:MAG: hypothetical protein QOI63_1374 [Thermoplasmata archaeon]|jgi:hypothetical protein|nr:hypothetical protein [Thermoplasmata archaeon]
MTSQRIRALLAPLLLAATLAALPAASASLLSSSCATPLRLNGNLDVALDTVGDGDTQYWYVAGASTVLIVNWNTVPIDVEAYTAASCTGAVACTFLDPLPAWTCTLTAGQVFSVTGSDVYSQYALVTLV